MQDSGKLTVQKRVVLEYLKSVHTHPTIQEVYFEVKKKLPEISQSTVYRILKRAAKEGKILEIPLKVSHFDADTSLHAHFICEKCQKIYDVFEIPEDCQKLVKRKIKVGKIKNCQIYFYGICKKCQK